MSNDYFNHTSRLVKHDTVRAADVNGVFDQVATAFDGVEADTNRALKVASGSMELTESAAQRAGKILEFDASGNPVAQTDKSVFIAACQDKVALAAAQANLATANGAAQVSLAADQVALAAAQANLATTNGATQVTLAADQVALAAGKVAETQAIKDGVSAIANFKGAWADLSGALPMPATAYHNGQYWALLNPLANVALSEPGISADWASAYGGIISVSYENRSALRAKESGSAIVDGLGLFAWAEFSTEPDDDETCFATTNGRWLLEAAAWDVAYAYWLADHAIQEENLEDLQTSVTGLQTSVALKLDASKLLRATFSMTLTTLAAITSSAFTTPVTGAALGDSVLVNPGNSFGTSAADQGRLSYTAYVSSPDTVTVSIRNASAAAATLTASTWNVLVIKQ